MRSGAGDGLVSRHAAQAEADLVALHVDVQHQETERLAHGDHLGGVLDLLIRQFAEVDSPRPRLGSTNAPNRTRCDTVPSTRPSIS